MQETIHDHHTSISIDGRLICNLRFADDFDFKGGNNAELRNFTSRLVKKI